MTPRRHKPMSTAVAAALSLLLLVAVGAAIVSSYLTAPKPSTVVDDLVANFEVNRQQFRTIATLASVDATFGIDVSDGSLVADGLDSGDVPRYMEVLEALDSIGAKHVSASEHALDVTTHSEGLAVSGRMYGYFYSTSSDVETVTLDVARSEDSPRVWLYPLGGGWYASDYRF